MGSFAARQTRCPRRPSCSGGGKQQQQGCRCRSSSRPGSTSSKGCCSSGAGPAARAPAAGAAARRGVHEPQLRQQHQQRDHAQPFTIPAPPVSAATAAGSHVTAATSCHSRWACHSCDERAHRRQPPSAAPISRTLSLHPKAFCCCCSKPAAAGGAAQRLGPPDSGPWARVSCQLFLPLFHLATPHASPELWKLGWRDRQAPCALSPCHSYLHSQSHKWCEQW